MTDRERFLARVRSQTSSELEEVYALALAEVPATPANLDAIDLIAGAIEVEYAHRHGWIATEAMTDRVAAARIVH